MDMSKLKRPQFFAMEKDFNTGEVKPYDVLRVVFDSILTAKGTIRNKNFYILDKKWNQVPVRTKEQLQKFIEGVFKYHYWAKCEWEFIAIDWPYRDTIEKSRPVKIDVFAQLEPNIPVITDLVWNYIEPKLTKLIEKENE